MTDPCQDFQEWDFNFISDSVSIEGYDHLKLGNLSHGAYIALRELEITHMNDNMR